MKSAIQIQIPEPCSESWGEMTRVERGRFCDSCKKTVVDFAAMSDVEILDYLKQNKEIGCGRFHATQLNRPIEIRQPAVAAFPFWGKLAASFLAFQLFVGDAAGQVTTKAGTVKTQQNERKQLIRTLKGKVLDDIAKIPLPGVEIRIDSLRLTTYSDAKGNYQIALPDDAAGKQLVVSASLKDTTGAAFSDYAFPSHKIFVGDSFPLIHDFVGFQNEMMADVAVAGSRYPPSVGCMFATLKYNTTPPKRNVWTRIKAFFIGKPNGTRAISTAPNH